MESNSNTLLTPLAVADLHKKLARGAYIGSENFLSNTTWTAEVSSDILNDATGTVQVACSVVGVVSNNNIFMDRHGDFGTGQNAMFKSEHRFELHRPCEDQFPAYASDFDRGIANLKCLARVMSANPSWCDLLGCDDSGKWFTKFHRLLFQRSVECCMSLSTISSLNRVTQLPARNIEG